MRQEHASDTGERSPGRSARRKQPLPISREQWTALVAGCDEEGATQFEPLVNPYGTDIPNAAEVLPSALTKMEAQHILDGRGGDRTAAMAMQFIRRFTQFSPDDQEGWRFPPDFQDVQKCEALVRLLVTDANDHVHVLLARHLLSKAVMEDPDALRSLFRATYMQSLAFQERCKTFSSGNHIPVVSMNIPARLIREHPEVLETFHQAVCDADLQGKRLQELELVEWGNPGDCTRVLHLLRDLLEEGTATIAFDDFSGSAMGVGQQIQQVYDYLPDAGVTSVKVGGKEAQQYLQGEDGSEDPFLLAARMAAQYKAQLVIEGFTGITMEEVAHLRNTLAARLRALHPKLQCSFQGPAVRSTPIERPRAGANGRRRKQS